MARIHPSSLVDPEANLHESVEIGPFCVVGKDVRIGAGTRLLSHVTICDHTRLGENNVVHMGAVVGNLPQFLGFDPSVVSYTVLGHNNEIREYTTINRSIVAGGETRLGDGNFLMTTSHVAHDCRVGNQTVMANLSILAGHVTLGDRAFVSGLTGAHQFVRIGELAMISGRTRVTKDAPPYMIVEGDSHVIGLNVVGLRRAGVGTAARSALNRAHRIVFRSGLSLPNALEAVRLEWADREMPPQLQHFLEFCSVRSKRGLSSAPRGGSQREETSETAE